MNKHRLLRNINNGTKWNTIELFIVGFLMMQKDKCQPNFNFILNSTHIFINNVTRT